MGKVGKRRALGGVCTEGPGLGERSAQVTRPPRAGNLTPARSLDTTLPVRPNALLVLRTAFSPTGVPVLSTIAAFFLGVFLAPAIRPLFRPVMIELIRGGVVLTDEVKRASATLGESMEDAKAEADAERARRATAAEPASASPKKETVVETVEVKAEEVAVEASEAEEIV